MPTVFSARYVRETLDGRARSRAQRRRDTRRHRSPGDSRRHRTRHQSGLSPGRTHRCGGERPIADGGSSRSTRPEHSTFSRPAAGTASNANGLHVDTDGPWRIGQAAVTEESPMKPRHPVCGQQGGRRDAGRDLRSLLRCDLRDSCEPHWSPERVRPSRTPISEFAEIALAGETIDIFGDGSHQREWLHPQRPRSRRRRTPIDLARAEQRRACIGRHGFLDQLPPAGRHGGPGP